MVDSQNGSIANETAVQVFTANNTSAQKWTVRHARDGYFALCCPRSGRVIDIKGNGMASGTVVQLYDYNGTSAQLWRIVPCGDGWFFLQSASGMYLTADPGTSNGNRLTVNAHISGSGSDSGQTQKFRFEETSSVASALFDRLGIAVDIRAGFLHGYKGSEHQKYIVLHDTEGTGSPKSVIDWWDGNGNKIASHFVVGTNGAIWQCVPLDQIAHHAGYGGVGYNARFGVTDESRDDKIGRAAPTYSHDYGMNSYSIGIEMVHVGGRGYSYPVAQLEALDGLIAYIDNWYGFESAIIDHKAWAPGNSDTSPEFAQYLRNYQSRRSYR
jgi:hypothetical protein